MILAGDIGGTNARLALFEPGTRGLELRWQRTYPSQQYPGLVEIVRAARRDSGARATAACFGIAGPVDEDRVDATNLPWRVEAREVASALELPCVVLLNDLQATAFGIATLPEAALRVLQAGEESRGNAALLAAGTGLGQAGLFWDGEVHRPFASEGGHADFAPSDELEARLFLWLRERHGHASWERVLSGPGLANLYVFLRDAERRRESPAVATEIEIRDDAAAIASAAAEGDPLAREALERFASLYGRAAGDVALQYLAVGGVYLGGGIAPKILAWLERPGFIEGFRSKGRMRALLEKIPLRVILDDRTAVFGAARRGAVELGVASRACRIVLP